MKKIVLIIFITLTIVNAQSEILTIEQSLKIGLNNSKEIQIANSDTIIANAQVTSAWSNLLPKVTLGANLNHLQKMPIQLNLPILPKTSDNELGVFYGNVSIEQPLFTGFRLLSLKNAAELNNKSISIDNSNARNKKALEIYKAFWNYEKTIKFIEILKENLKIIDSQKKDVENFVKGGVATKNDLLRIQVAEADVKSKIIDAEHKSKIAQANFNREVGININTDTKIKVDVLLNNLSNEDFPDLLNEAIQSRPELLSNNYKMEAAEKRITAAQSTWYPQISAFGSYYYVKFNGSSLLDDEASKFWMVGLGMQWNIWDWWKTSANTSIAVEQHFQIDVMTKMLKDKIELEVYNNYLNLESEAEKINLNKLQVESAEENFRIISEKFATQVATSTELSEASTLLTEAKIKLITSYIDYKLAKIELDNSVGRKIY